jgi:hypothetical protein
VTQLTLDFSPPRSRQPWQRMRSWKGGWWEGWCTDLELECLCGGTRGCGRATLGGCTQEDIYNRRSKRRYRIARPARAWRVRLLGGEPNRVHDPPPSPWPARIPAPLTLEWFLAHGWHGSRVEVEEVKGCPPERRRKFTLYHPSGAVLSLKPGAVYEEGEDHG